MRAARRSAAAIRGKRGRVLGKRPWCPADRQWVPLVAAVARYGSDLQPYPRTNSVSVPKISSHVRRNWSICGFHRNFCNRSLYYPHWLLVPTKNLAGAEQCQTDHENAALQPIRPNENGTRTIEPFDLPAALDSVPRDDTNVSRRQRITLTCGRGERLPPPCKCHIPTSRTTTSAT